MKLTINDKEYTTNFGMGFVRRINQATANVIDGVSISTGVTQYLTKFYQLSDLEAFADLLYFSLWKEQNAIKQVDVDAYIDELEEKGELEAFIDDFMDELVASTVGKKAEAQMKENIAAQKAKTAK